MQSNSSQLKKFPGRESSEKFLTLTMTVVSRVNQPGSFNLSAISFPDRVICFATAVDVFIIQLDRFYTSIGTRHERALHTAESESFKRLRLDLFCITNLLIA